MYTLHTTAGDTGLEAGNVEELLSELQRRRSRGEFLKEQSKKRWMAVSTDGGYLVARLDLRTKDEWTLYTVFGEHDVSHHVGSGMRPPYVIHTTGGDVQTAAWSVQEFRIELARGLDDRRIPGFHDAPNMGRSRTVTQGRRRVGLIDWETGEFTPTDRTEDVAYSVRHGAGWFPTEANDLDALRAELTVLTRSGAFLQTGQRGHWVEVEGPHGVVERRVARYSQEYREKAVSVPYMVHRARTNVAGKRHYEPAPHYEPPLKCTAKETGELRLELGTLLHDGEFQNEEDCRIRWLPVTQGDWLVGYVDAAERLFVPKTKRRIRYRIGTERGDGLPMAADAVDGLRSELEARTDDLRHLVAWGRKSERVGGVAYSAGYPVADVRCEGRIVGRVADDGEFLRLLLIGTDEQNPDGASCESCRYWQFRDEVPVGDRETRRIETIVSEGQCRRWSPHPRHGWPVTNCGSWCGEYRSGPESG